MSERKRRRRSSDFSDFFDFGFDEGKLFEQEPFEGRSGYSISVSYDEKGKPVVKVKTYGGTDVAELRREIERQYPGARIEGLEKQPLIRIVDEKKREVREGEPENKEERIGRKEKQRSSMRIVE